MITVTNCRTRGNEPPFAPIVNACPPQRALETLVIYELGYGGHVVDITPTKVTTVTTVMDCVDTTHFEGTAEEMEPLLRAAGIAVTLAVHKPQSFDDKVLDQIMAITKGVPLLVKLGSGLIQGGANIRVIAAALFDCPDHAEVLMRKPVKDVLAAYCLHAFDGATLEDAIGLLN